MQTLFMLPDSLWKEVSQILDPKPRRRKVPLQTVLSGIIYLLQNGCKWASLPPHYGNAKNTWYYYHKWMVFGLLESVLYMLNVKLRTAEGRNGEPSQLIIDSQSVKSHSPGSSEAKGYDAGKKVPGRKRHLAVDTQGNSFAVGVTAASEHDKRGALSLEEQVTDLGSVRSIVGDGSYRGAAPFDDDGRIGWEVVEKKATGGRFRVLPKRWVVERTFAWLGNFRRLARDYEKSVTMAKAMLLMASIYITLKKLSTYF